MPELECVEDDATPINEWCGGDKAFVDLFERRRVQPLWEVPGPVFEGRDHALLPHARDYIQRTNVIGLRLVARRAHEW